MKRKIRLMLLVAAALVLLLLVTSPASARCVTAGFNGYGTTQCVPV